MKIGIIGTGAYGLALGISFHDSGNDVIMWTKFEDEKTDLCNKRCDDSKLPGIIIPKEIEFTNDIKKAVINQDLIIMAIPAEYVDETMKLMLPHLNAKQSLCIASKGIENNTCALLTDVVNRYIHLDKIAVIAGPSFAIDIASKVPIGLALATVSSETKDLIKKSLANSNIRLKTTDDVLGVEICSASKNVIALAVGMLVGMNLPESTRAMFITDAIHDIKRLIDKLGGQGKTIMSYAGFGDLLLTCTSNKSRNFCYGQLIGQSSTKDELSSYLDHHTVEGIYTLQSLQQLIMKNNLELPIIDCIYQIVFNNQDPKSLLTLLNAR